MSSLAVINLTDVASYTAALESFPTMRVILEAVHGRVIDRQNANFGCLIEAEMEVTNYRLTLELRQDDVIIVERVKALPKGFYSPRFFALWHTDLPSTRDFQCSFERRARDVIARFGHEAFSFNVEKDRDVLAKAVTTLQSLPEIMLEAHYNSSVLPRLTLDFYNEYLVDLLNADSFQCFNKERFDLMQGERLFYEVKEVLERCGSRLSLFQLLLEPVCTWLTSHASTEGLPVVDTGLVDVQILVKSFQTKLTFAWAQF